LILLIKYPSHRVQGRTRSVEIIKQEHGLAAEGLIAHPIGILEQLDTFIVGKHILEFLGVSDLPHEALAYGQPESVRKPARYFENRLEAARSSWGNRDNGVQA
jgi:hypothetical protein